jgi:hypothetical protein
MPRKDALYRATQRAYLRILLRISLDRHRTIVILARTLLIDDSNSDRQLIR